MGSLPFKINRRTLGAGWTIHFQCPRCKADLHAPDIDAGKNDSCPDCSAAFVVPGADEIASLRKAAEQEAVERAHRAEQAAERRRREAAERAEAERAQRASVQKEWETANARRSPFGPIHTTGIVLTLTGMATSIVAVVMDTTNGDVHNVGKLNDKLVTAIFAASLFISGTLLIGLASVANIMLERLRVPRVSAPPWNDSTPLADVD